MGNKTDKPSIAIYRISGPPLELLICITMQYNIISDALYVRLT